MQHFRRLFSGLDVKPAMVQLEARPELWGHHPVRTDMPGSPHGQSKDIWLRFKPQRELAAPHDPRDYATPHFAEFWPAWWLLPGLHSLAYDVMRAVEAVYLGGILMTKIPAGKAILPHVDTGWHPEFNDTKAYVILQANRQCINRCLDESVVMAEGDAWTFRNDIEHSVENNGDTDRIAMILTLRTEKHPCQ